MAQIEALEADLAVKRTESDVRKLEKIYTRGYNDAAQRFAELKTYLAVQA